MKIILLSVFVLVLFSCKKKEFPSAVTIGDKEAVQEVGYNFLLSGSNSNSTVSVLDLDQDGVNDVKFYNFSTPVVGSGVMPEISIETLHPNIEMNVDVREDSVFRAYFYHWQYAPDGTRAFFHINVTSCERESQDFWASSKTETNSYLVPLEEGSMLSVDDIFQSGTFDISTANKHITTTEFYPDSTVYHIEETKRSCFEFPQNSIRYLGFRMTNEEGHKLGWIELEYLGGNKLRIRDWAIQQ
ncbi:MAG: hypothetical protein ACFHU9_15085 [Fluviicola sp.]